MNGQLLSWPLSLPIVAEVLLNVTGLNGASSNWSTPWQHVSTAQTARSS